MFSILTSSVGLRATRLVAIVLIGCAQFGIANIAQGTTWVCPQADGTQLYSDREISLSCRKVEESAPLNKAQPRTPDGSRPVDDEKNPQGQGTQNVKNACQADAKQFCSTVEPGGGRIKECLLDHFKDVSDECYGTLQKQGPKQ